MVNRLASVLLLGLGTSLVLAACDDGDDRIDDMTGGEGGSGAGTKTGGSSSGGSAGKGGKGGSPTGGGQGGQSPGEAGAAGEAGMTGEGGDTSMGGAPVGGSGPTEGGAAGMGGAGGAENPPVTYACGDTSINRRLCSALVAAQCDTLPACEGDPPPDPCCSDCMTVVCTDCVPLVASERQNFVDVGCQPCVDEYDRHLNCGIDPFEAGNLSEGVVCYDGYGAAVHDENCYPLFASAEACLFEEAMNGCPATWPLPE